MSYVNEIYHVRTMDMSIIRKIREYCIFKDIPWRFVDDGVNPYEINFKTDRKTYEQILFMNGINEK